MTLVKLALVFVIVAWYRGDWVRAQLRRHARAFGDALARFGVGVRGTEFTARAPLEWTVEDGTDTSARGRLAHERRAILEGAKRRAGARGGLGVGASSTAEKLEDLWARRRSRRFAGGAGDGTTRDAFPEKALDALVAERRARAAAAAERHAQVRERVRQRRQKVGDAASAMPR